jgi:predicted permease
MGLTMKAALRSLRALRRHWTLTAISAFSLSVAMALGIVALSVSNTVLLLPPAAPSADRLVTIYHRAPGNPTEEISYPDYEYYRRNNHVFTDIAAAPNSISVNVDWGADGREVKIVSRPVSENYFAVLGIRPLLGRLFAPGDDESKSKIAVMTYACWRRLGADPNIVGKVIGGNTIVGVTPKNFTGSFYGLNGDLLSSLAQFDNDPSWRTHRDARRFFLTARLKPGVDRRQARAEMASLAAQLASAYPKDDQNRAAVVARATLLPPDALPTAEWATAILMALVLLVLLIACANVSNLLLAVAVARRRQTAIQLALGAPRGRLVREFLMESVLLCIFSGLLGYGIAAATIARFSDFTVVFPMFGAFMFGLHLRLDATVMGLALLLTIIASLATGLAPALYASSPALAQILGGELVGGGPQKGVRRNALLIVEVAVATLVLVGMGLCQRNLYNLRHTDPGFSARNLVAVSVYLRAEGYEGPKGKEFYQILRRTVGALPGVESLALAAHLPLLGASPVPVQPPGGGKPVSISHNIVDADYFSTFGIRILAGRAFNAADHEKSPAVAVINRKMADEFFPGQDPVGRSITAGDPARKVTVVGIAANGRYEDIDEPQHPFLYFPLNQDYQTDINVIARTRGDPRLWIGPFAQAMRGLGLKIMVQPVTLESWMNLTLLGQRVAAGCVAGLSALGLLLAVLGLAGAISYSVSQRKKELGIRVALGARPEQLMKMVLRQTLVLAGAGVAVGAVLGIGATMAFRSLLYGIGVVEWSVLLPVAAAMLAISLAVAYWSARPWVKVDPMEAIRHA